MTIEITSKKRSLIFLKNLDKTKIRIGVPVKDGEDKKVGLNNIGDTLVPSPTFGKVCERNSIGYEYIDTTKKKERRYVSTVWMYPYGNTNASRIAVDISRLCYPRYRVEPEEIELALVSNENQELFVLADINPNCSDDCFLNAINILIEIYGKCYIFEDILMVEAKRKRVNWQILPPGEKPSNHIKAILRERHEDTDTFDVDRLKQIERYRCLEIVAGLNGFLGYFVYVFERSCVLESAFYGNATYIIPKDNWEILSQKTKKELFDNKLLIAKIIHNADWERNIRKVMKEIENQTPSYWH